MTTLRQRMWEDMRIRNLSVTTQKRYLDRVAVFANHFNKSPALLGAENIRVFLLYLVREKKLSSSSINVTVSALRFLYRVTLGCQWDIEKIHFAIRIYHVYFILTCIGIINIVVLINPEDAKGTI